MATFARTRKSHIWVYLLLIFVLLLLLLRLILPSIMTSYANSKLRNASPYFSFHINDIDLHLLKGQYVVKGMTGVIKHSNEQFLKINGLVTNVPWNSVFKGRPLVDVVINQLDLSASQILLNNAKLEAERLKQKAAKEDQKESPVYIRSLSLKDSNVKIHDFMSFKGSETRSISRINLMALNLTPTDKSPTTNFAMTADVFGLAPLNLIGQAEIKNLPIKWDVNAELKNFELKSINPFLQEKVKVSIQSGNMDLYTEIECTGDHIDGYIKPFISKLKIDMPKAGIATATGANLMKLLTDSESKALSANIPFTFTNKLNIEIFSALEEALIHRDKQNIQPGIDDRIGQRGLGVTPTTIQAQEAE